MKKALVLFLITAIAVTALAGCLSEAPRKDKEQAVSVFTLDVNPGVRVYVDENG